MQKHIFSWEGFKPQKADAEISAYRKNEFAKHHDVALATSVHGGRSHITLWASGRVTETTLVEQKPPVSGLSAYIDDEKEIEPAFDFVTN